MVINQELRSDQTSIDENDVKCMAPNISNKIAHAPCEDSDQPAHSRNLIRVFAELTVGRQGSISVLRGTVTTLISLRGCAGSS